ncbi:HAD-IC family P-type ATPase, partial [Escherichia coli]|uniref:HAD-IC family P-type ATPase n=2 Tax=Bacteria TaxID=2 RepID=UPI001C52E652
GTITNGRPVVTDYHGDNQTLQLLATAEKDSEHPLAEAIVNYAKDKHMQLTETTSFKAVPGHGIEATIEDHHILVGNRKLMAENDISLPKHISDDLTNYEQDGKTAMLIAVNHSLTGIIAVADTVKEHAKDAIKQLHDMGIEVAMLTGDNKNTAQAIAKQVGIDTVIADILPEEKAAQIAKLQQQGKKVAMVGD